MTPDSNHELRTAEELVNAALTETDEDLVWNAVSALHWKGSRDVLTLAEMLCASTCCQERSLGADILGQLGVPERTFPSECCWRLRQMLRPDEHANVLYSVLVALSHQNDSGVVPRIIEFASHTHADVRHGVVLALSGHDDINAIECLVRLSEDRVTLVRDWATFALGSQTDLNTAQIRDALSARLEDPDDDTRGEALVGLARRKDNRVVAALKRELSSDCVGSLAIEAAELIGSKELQPYLHKLRQWWDVDKVLLEQAIAASQ